MRHIPNILSGIRLALVGVFTGLFVAGKYLPALSVFVIAFLTDVVDGHLARTNGWVSDVGKLLDPLADKCMTVAALVCIYTGKQKVIYLVLFLIVLVKELLMLIGGIYMMKRNVVAVADWPGKIATGLFAGGIVLTLISFLTNRAEVPGLLLLLAATGVSCFALFYYASHQFSRTPKSGAEGRPSGAFETKGQGAGEKHGK